MSSRDRGRGRPPTAWQLARVAVTGSTRQAFLDRRWIPWLLRAAPQGRRRGIALRILSLSPHYFIYQWDGYPGAPRASVLEAEFERNRASRSVLAERLVVPRVDPGSSVLDFGCGPGFVAREVSERVPAATVIALDISVGTLACASELNPGPQYRCSRDSRLPLADASLDFVYSFAVFQHIEFSEWPGYFAAFFNALRPGGRGLCHVALADGPPPRQQRVAGIRGLYSLLYQETSSEFVRGVLADAGFVDVELWPTIELAVLDDDIGRSHIATFVKAA